MKKKDIITLLEYRKNEIASETCDAKKYPYKDILDYELPDIKGIEKQLSILNEELKKIKSEKISSIKYVENNKGKVEQLECSHPVLLGVHDFFGKSYYCALCQNIKQSTRGQSLKNKVAIYHELDEDLLMVRPKEEFFELYNLIMDILKDKNDDEEIDFVKEFQRLYENYTIGTVTIDGKTYSRVYKVLVISGSNSFKINKEVYMSKPFNEEVFDIIKYLTSKGRVYITSLSSLNEKEFEKYIKTLKYKSINELYDTLTELSSEDYNLIIDISNLFEYNISDNEINISNINLDLNSFFPNSMILRLNNESNFNIALYDLLEKNNKFGNDFKKVLIKK